MKISIGGDCFLGGDLNEFSGKIVNSKMFGQADFRFVNLEQAASSSPEPVDKCTIYSSDKALDLLLENNINGVGLANNHIHDLGPDGIVGTRGLVERLGVKVTGAGSTIEQAAEAVTIDGEVSILSYCDFDKWYLNDIAVANLADPGVNPLRYEKINADLLALPSGSQAILVFHWGVEHVRYPPHKDIELAKRLLELDAVALIVGMHSHLAQGYIESNGKRAYMGIGNFLFPEFYFDKPTQIIYPEDKKAPSLSTFGYHRVTGLTKKKWRYFNRVSMLIFYDTKNGSVSHSFAKQAPGNIPYVTDVVGLEAAVWDLFVKFLSLIYRQNKSVYSVFELSSYAFRHVKEVINNAFFYLRQDGMGFVVKKSLARIKSILPSRN